ncbi:hypothetical protein GL263_08865 [Streptomyces durbertensis]|uniref:Uncharacterized protein n=1 Tax=Streptomyces durbertensis TaxID=2448886 RepID=A0ABR6EEJ2_9ACTN|nr:hypothetical protein [Streptomyces durbertensis]MBB1243668.1 hypothetical protein [Streptomyces durbertensis]
MTRSEQVYAYARPPALRSSAHGPALGLETSGGLTPSGPVTRPEFFTGFLTRPEAASAALPALRAVKINRLADALATAGNAGAPATAWAVLAGLPPPLLAEESLPRGTTELLTAAADCAAAAGARGELPGLAALAARTTRSRQVSEARRLHTTLTS